jgi:MFS family permease
MSNELSDASPPGVIDAIRIDLARLYAVWMGILFPRQRESHSVLGKWEPETTLGTVKYRIWGVIGAVVLVILYPLTLLGFAARFYARRIDRTAASIGTLGVVLVSVLAWGLLTAVAQVRFESRGFIAVAAAGVVATVSAVLARVFTRGGRVKSVLVGYPFAVTAIFLPPVVAALYSPALAEFVFPRSELLAIWILDNLLFVFGLNTLIRATFNLQGVWYVAMWFGIAVPVGWFVGGLVALAELVRPTDDSGNPQQR